MPEAMRTAQAAHCPLCSSPADVLYPFGYSFNGRWLQALGCAECGGIFLSPQPSREEIAAMYSREYFEGDFRCGHEGSYFSEKTLSRIADPSMLTEIRSVIPAGRFLEIGCAGGAFLNAARSCGYEVRGVEVSAEAAEFARRKFGLDVVTGDLASAHFPDGTYDVVFMADVLEHLPDPGETLREVRAVMRAGGLLVVICPTQTNTLFSRAGFLAYSILGKRATVHLPPYHLFEYRPGSLRKLLERKGFDVLRVKGSVIPPRELALRGSLPERAGKKLFQYPNALITGAFGSFGDRIEVFAVKKGQETT